MSVDQFKKSIYWILDMNTDALIKECNDNVYYTYGTTRIFEKRASKLKQLRTWITFLGIAVPLIVGSLFLSFGAKSSILPIVSVLSGIVITAQLVMSSWSIVARWDESYESSIDSVRGNTYLYNRWKWLVNSPANLQDEYKKIKEDHEKQEFKDLAQAITDGEKRFATHEALMYFKKPCHVCKNIPKSSKPTQCDGCGNY